ncbi:MAG: GNAT family N-acetyltransferase [Oscillospiraceae bacterium]|nr:GNAT family N-acetyltransferase [Oscillospiraceae bacterium]
MTESVKYCYYQTISQNFKNNALNYFAALVRHPEEQIFVVRNTQEEIVGCAILLLQNLVGNSIELSYIFVKDGNRSKGYGNLLFDAALNWAHKLGKSLTFRLQDINNYKNILLHMLEKRSAKLIDMVCVYQHSVNDQSRAQWQEVTDKSFSKIRNLLLAQGFECKSFESAEPAILDKIYKNNNNFDKKYDAAGIAKGHMGIFLPSYSFVSYKNGEPAAIVMTTESCEESAVVQLISAAKNYEKSGAVLISIMSLMEKIFNFKYKKIGYCVSSDNNKMLKTIRDTFLNIEYLEIKQFKYLIS